MKQLLPYFKNYWGRMLLLGLLYIVATLSNIFLPYLMSNIVDKGIALGRMDVIYVSGAWMLLFALLSLGCSICSAKLTAVLAAGIANDLQKGLLQKVGTLTFEQYASIGTSSLLTRTTHDVMIVRDAAGMVVNVCTTVPILFVGGTIFALMSDSVLALVFLASAPIVLLLVRLVSRKLGELFENSDRYIDAQNRIMRERLSGIRVIRAFDTELHEHQRIKDATERMAENIIRGNVRANTITPVCMLLLNLATVVMLLIGANRIQNPELLEQGLTAGNIIAAVQYVALILSGLLMLSWGFVFLPHLKVGIRRISEVLAIPSAKEEPSKGLLDDATVRMERVSFCYPNSEERTLTDLNMELRAGETVAVIGGTGSGKSTIVKLLLAFYPVTEGRLTFGGKTVEELGVRTVRENVSVALQKGMLFEGTILENVRASKEEASEEEVMAALSDAMMREFVESNAEGLSYHIAQSGTNISGGQKQRINIARAILKEANLYIFDDSFSALDYLTESQARRRINARLQGKTQLIITQRAATAMRCDRIYVLDQGRIVGSGTHSELVDSCEVYGEIVRSQLGGGYEE